MNIARYLERSAYIFPDRPALSEDSTEITYSQMNERVNQTATALLKMGVKPGDCIGLCAPNSIDWMTFYYGVIKTGAVAVTISCLVKPDELRYYYDHSQFKMIFTTDDKLDILLKLKNKDELKIICPNGDLSYSNLLTAGTGQFKAVDRNRSDTVAILYTGGTTGNPKGVMLTHENVSVAIHNVAFDERSNENDRTVCFVPLNHVHGQMHVSNATILTAGCLELMPSFDIERVLNLMKAGRITKLMAVPTIFVRMLGLDHLEQQLGSVKYCFSAGSSLSANVVNQWKERTGLSIYEGYGMTEASPTVAYNDRFRHVVGSVGSAVPSVEIQIRDLHGNCLNTHKEGEVCVQGRNIMKGYLNNLEATKEAFWDGGWFRSGDVGYLDDAGYLYIVDRIKDMIITGGENVYSREVEEVLYKYPEIEECAVIGLPDPEWGEQVTAVVSLKPGREIDIAKLRASLKEHLSSFKVPKEIKILTELPKSPAGKILKRELRKKFLEG